MALTKIPNNLITADAIDGTLIANNAINSEHYTDGSIDTAHIGNLQITNALMADDAIGVAELSATGTASSSTFLRGDNAWSTIETGTSWQAVQTTGFTAVAGNGYPCNKGLESIRRRASSNP